MLPSSVLAGALWLLAVSGGWKWWAGGAISFPRFRRDHQPNAAEQAQGQPEVLPSGTAAPFRRRQVARAKSGRDEWSPPVCWRHPVAHSEVIYPDAQNRLVFAVCSRLFHSLAPALWLAAEAI